LILKGDNDTDSISLKVLIIALLNYLHRPLQVLYDPLNVLRSCDLTPQAITLSTPNLSSTPTSEIPHIPSKSINTAHKYPQDLDINPTASYNTLIHIRSTLMSVAYQQASKVKYRVTLELEVFEDMNPHNIQWDRVLDLEPAEKCEAYVESLSTPDRW
jgi:hypothetical protein